MKYKPLKMKVNLTLTTDQLGTIPKSQNVFEGYLKHRAKGKEGKDEFKSPLSDEQITEKEAKAWTGFMEEDGKPFIMEHMIKGFLKNAGNLMKGEGLFGLKTAKSKINDFVFVSPRKIFFSNVEMSALERPLRAMTMQGPRVSLVKSDSIKAGAKLSFVIEVPLPCDIKEKHILKILDYGKYLGLGQFRNGGYGRFDYEVC